MGQPVLADTLLSIISDLERRLVALERSPQLTSASIKDGALTVYNASGQAMVVLGRQADGTYGLSSFDVDGTQVVDLGENNTVSRGRLGYATSDDHVSRSTQGTTDMPDLSVAVTVPANRVLRVTGQAAFTTLNNGAGGPAPVVGGRVYADGANLGFFAFLSILDTAATGTLYHDAIRSGSIIHAPPAGDHTYKLVAEMVTADVGSITAGGTPSVQAFILVEDIGPAS